MSNGIILCQAMVECFRGFHTRLENELRVLEFPSLLAKGRQGLKLGIEGNNKGAEDHLADLLAEFMNSSRADIVYSLKGGSAKAIQEALGLPSFVSSQSKDRGVLARCALLQRMFSGLPLPTQRMLQEIAERDLTLPTRRDRAESVLNSAGSRMTSRFFANVIFDGLYEKVPAASTEPVQPGQPVPEPPPVEPVALDHKKMIEKRLLPFSLAWFGDSKPSNCDVKLSVQVSHMVVEVSKKAKPGTVTN